MGIFDYFKKDYVKPEKKNKQKDKKNIDIKDTKEYWEEASKSQKSELEIRKGKKRFYSPREIIGLYDELLYSLFAGDDSLNGRIIYNEEEKIGVDFIATHEGEEISFYYLIDKFPQKLNINWKDRLRRECGSNIRLSFIEDMKNYAIQWESPEMSSKLRVLHEVKEDIEGREINAYNMHKNIRDISNQRWIEESLLYLSDADMNRSRDMFKFCIFVIVSGRRGEEFNDSIKRIGDVARGLGLGWQRVMYEIPDYIHYFSPFSHELKKEIEGQIPYKILPDEQISRFSTYSQGILGDGGTYFGTDIYSKFPVLKQVKRTAESAENWLITAETGGGKSFIVKALLLQLLAQGYNGTIMDIEGREYLPLANFISHKSKVLIVNMAEGSGKYFDPLAITTKTGIDDIDKESKNMSLNFTLSILKVLLGRASEENRIMDVILNDVVTEVYRDYGVTEDIETWGNSKDLTLFDVYDKLKYMKQRRYRDTEEYLNALDEARGILSKYFEPDGTRSNLFKEKINVADLMDADLVICSFGMEGKSETSVDSVQMSLMQLGAAHLSHQRSIFSRMNGKFNFKVWEEFQRWGKFPGSEKTLGVAVTGGRKLGDVNIIVSNFIKQLLDGDNFGIFSNTTSFLCGAIADSAVREEFCRRLSIEYMAPELDKISEAQTKEMAVTQQYRDSEGREKINQDKAPPKFLVGLDRESYGIVQMLIPAQIATSDLFRTGVKLEERKQQDGEE